MRIGLLANTFEPLFAATAGGHVHFLQVAKHWADHEIVIFAPEIAREPFLRELPAARFVAMPSFARLSSQYRLAFLLRAIAGVRQRSELRRCDVLLCTSHFIADTVPALAARPRRTAVLLWHVIEPPSRRAQGSWAGNLLAYLSERVSIALVRRFAGACIVGSAHLADELRFNRGTKQIAVTTNGVDLATPAQGNAFGITTKDAIYVGRIHPSKGIEDLVRAWSLLPERCAASRLFLVGGGSEEYRSVVRDAIAAAGLDEGRVIFCGRVDEPMKSALLHAAGIFVFASPEEGWGIALAEAMAAGLPCVTYNLPIFTEVFASGRVGAALHDTKAFANACAMLLCDEEARRACGREAKERSRYFSWKRAAQVEMSVLQALSMQ